jgi:hypothetical protein
MSSSMCSWTSDTEAAFLQGELPAFKAIRDKSAQCYGKVNDFFNGLYSRFVTVFPLKNDETPDSKQKVMSLFNELEC